MLIRAIRLTNKTSFGKEAKTDLSKLPAPIINTSVSLLLFVRRLVTSPWQMLKGIGHRVYCKSFRKSRATASFTLQELIALNILRFFSAVFVPSFDFIVHYADIFENDIKLFFWSVAWNSSSHDRSLSFRNKRYPLQKVFKSRQLFRPLTIHQS